MRTAEYIEMTIKVLNEILEDLDNILDRLDKTLRVNPAMYILGLIIPPILLDRSKKEYIYSAKIMEDIRDRVKKLREILITPEGEYLIPKTDSLDDILYYDFDYLIDKLYERADAYSIGMQIKDLMKKIESAINELKELPYQH